KDDDEPQRTFFDKQLAIYEFVEVRPNLRTQGKELGIDDIANYGFNAVRIEVGTVMSVWSGGQHAGDHNTQRYATGKANGKFDLSKPDTEWLDALRLWGEECEKRGIHFIVDLFDGCNVKHNSSKCNDPFYGCLNVNGVIAKDGNIREEMFNLHPRVLQYQYKRIDMVCGALRGLKNVIIELANEAGGSQVVNWRRKMIEYILPRYNVRLCTNPHWNESDEFNLDYVAIHNRMDMKRAYKAIDELNPNGRDNLPGKVIISSDSPGWDDTAQLYGFIYNVLKAGGSFALCPYQGDWQQRLEIVKKALDDVGHSMSSKAKIEETVENMSEVAYKIAVEDGISGTAHFGRPEGGVSKIWSAWQYGRKWVKVYDYHGKLRWSRDLNGPPRHREWGCAEVPATWWDINFDGKDEYICEYYENGKHYLGILEGLTGKIINKHVVKEKAIKRYGVECIYICNLRGLKYPQDLVLTVADGAFLDAYGWDPEVGGLKILWEWTNPHNPSGRFHPADGGGRWYGAHYPKGGDIDGDGKDEIVVGRYWLDDNGTVLKNPKSFPVREHADSVCVTDKLDGDMTVVCSW
ncbi:hypothetical protein KAU11_06335, partial [Candidatus Babeliales bacterium]|nr:hypothetical protein [Candidatus Babeliales bacterium]